MPKASLFYKEITTSKKIETRHPTRPSPNRDRSRLLQGFLVTLCGLLDHYLPNCAGPPTVSGAVNMLAGGWVDEGQTGLIDGKFPDTGHASCMTEGTCAYDDNCATWSGTVCTSYLTGPTTLALNTSFDDKLRTVLSIFTEGVEASTNPKKQALCDVNGNLTPQTETGFVESIVYDPPYNAKFGICAYDHPLNDASAAVDYLEWSEVKIWREKLLNSNVVSANKIIPFVSTSDVTHTLGPSLTRSGASC